MSHVQVLTNSFTPRNHLAACQLYFGSTALGERLFTCVISVPAEQLETKQKDNTNAYDEDDDDDDTDDDHTAEANAKTSCNNKQELDCKMALINNYKKQIPTVLLKV